MLTQPHAKRILCFGDSNTWGQRPESKGRFGEGERWTALLQQTLGDGYDIIEEGLSSRTTDLEYSRKPGRNGRTYFVPCLQSQNPLGGVIIMLGTNDYKIEFGPRSPQDVAKALASLVADTKALAKNEAGEVPRIMLISPICINEKAEAFAELYTGFYDQRSVDISRSIAPYIKELAQKTGCTFIDAAEFAEPGGDGIHMDATSHADLAAALAPKIEEWFA